MTPLFGHSLGHSGVAIDTGNGSLLHCGDAYFHRGEVDRNAPRCPAAVRGYEAAVAAGRSRIEKSLERAVKAGKLDDDVAMASLARVRFTTDLGEFADRQLVIEAVREFEEEKLEVFRSLRKIVVERDGRTAIIDNPGYAKASA